MRSKPSARDGAAAEQFEDAPGAGAEIDQKIERPLAQRLVHGRFDVALGDMQRADLVPLAGMGLEIGLRRFGAGLLHGCGAGAVAGEREVARIEAGDDGFGERRLGAGLGQPEKHPRAFAEAPDQAGIGHELQMPADARLALAEDLGEVLDVQLAAGKQRQDAQARGLAGGAQCGKGGGARQAWGFRSGIG